MYKRWYNTNAMAASSMLDVTDEMILGWSDGEVTLAMPPEEDENQTGTLTDPSIFGELGTDSLQMGHISLAAPIVNIHYTHGKRPVLPALLKMETKDLDEVIYYGGWAVIEPGESGLCYKQVLSEKEYLDASGQKGFKAMMGAEAVSALLEKDGVEGTDGIILSRVPVVPTQMRLVSRDNGTTYKDTDLELLYCRVVNRSNRVKRLSQLGAPEIIMRNECRMLQETVDALINNGARGIPVSFYDGTPMNSLTELNEKICTFTFGKHNSGPTEVKKTLATAKMETLAHEFATAVKKADDDDMASQEEIWELHDQWHDRMAEEFRPICAAVIENDFSEYADEFYDDMLWWGMNTVTKTADEYSWLSEECEEDIDVVDFFSRVFYKNIRFFVKKKIMFEQEA